ncbi:MAG TPA: hypothetical protein VKU19_11240 [Bryobacteraceae bacterium]|nr:hypothetical protein [Bryobacteraceae bacterium]
MTELQYLIRKADTWTLTLVVLWLFVPGGPALAQPSAATLKVELRNVVEYQVDTSDLSKWGTNPNSTPGKILQGMGVGCAGVPAVIYGDIVTVNGNPAKGTYVAEKVSVCMSPTPSPGLNAIADVSANSVAYETYYILQTDATPVGSIMTEGLNAVSPSPPGPPAGSLNFAIVGGTGAFLGARGQTGNAAQGLGMAAIPIRAASITEDPANRRQNGGGHVVFTLYVVPQSVPGVAVTPGGPAVTHSADFSLVTASKPAAAGEILTLFATGFGPTRPALSPGQTFPSTPLAVVNSPVAVTVNGNAAEVLSATGYPGTTDGYQINFRVPADTTKGIATIVVSAAWIEGPPVTIPVQ